MTAVARGKRQPESSISAKDMNAQWRIRCQVLEDQLQDARADYSALQQRYDQLHAGYKSALDRLWKASAGIAR